MKLLDATTAGRMALAGVARPAMDQFGGGAGTYPCEWRPRVSTFGAPTVNLTDAISHKAWRPKEPSP
ncbi:hypothetical protein [Actinomarinicola tropica]|uniref:Uncharacterized protein n=1 Tax=Actinomarinicola tropica TaxID=2789776 RepID=A0A5Q2RDE3_9ACTN|nr:hypothetical protein [Actinomarinicola tropica]QGG93724.1 hypothetical protein GH723_00580 [Actinomarinicola tropica]